MTIAIDRSGVYYKVEVQRATERINNSYVIFKSIYAARGNFVTYNAHIRAIL